MKKIRETAKQIYEYLQPYCTAIYLGGSRCEGIINHPHDVDFICFSEKPIDMCNIRRLLFFYTRNHELPNEYDFVQVRNTQEEEHSYGSYINKRMIKLVGKDINFKFDVANKHRDEYKQILISTITKLNTGKIQNQKRWYQILRGYYILKNNSYNVSDEEKNVLNIVHDQLEGWEQYKITKEDILKS